MKPTGCTVEMRCVVGETGAVRQGGAPVEFTVLHVEGFAVKGREEGGGSPNLVPDGTRSTVTLHRPLDEVESAVVEFACPTCGRTVSVRVRSRAECSRLRRRRLARGLAALLAAFLAVWILIDTVTAGPEGGEILFCMVVAIGSPFAAIYGAFWTVTALAGKGIAIEGEPKPLEMAGALGPQDQLHVDGARFIKHSV